VEGALAAPKRNRMNDDAKFIDNSGIHQAHREVGAAQHEQILSSFPFDLLDLLPDVRVHQPRRWPIGAAERRRYHNLRECVHQSGMCGITCRRFRSLPIFRHALVGHAPEDEFAGIVDLSFRELVEFVVSDRPVEFAVGPFLKAIHGRDDERDQLSDRGYSSGT